MLKLLEGELQTKILELTQQKNQIERKWVNLSESNRQLRTSDQPAFMSSPAYKSLMATVTLGANSGQVHTHSGCELIY